MKRKILFGLLFIFLFWIGFHFFAWIGIIAALLYPVIWLFLPKELICLTCLYKKKKKTYPKTFLSAISNGFLLFIFACFSYVLIYSEYSILAGMGYPLPEKTASFSVPQKGQHRIGEIFPMKIRIENIDRAINTVQADISYDPAIVEAIDILTDESFATIFLENKIDNVRGNARLSGGLPNSGWEGNNETFGTVYFRALKPGSAKITFLPSSIILANDGKGTDILKKPTGATYEIIAASLPNAEQIAQQEKYTKRVAESKSENQMHFYNKKQQSTMEPIAYKSSAIKTNFTDGLLHALALIDKYIITMWGKYFQITV